METALHLNVHGERYLHPVAGLPLALNFEEAPGRDAALLKSIDRDADRFRPLRNPQQQWESHGARRVQAELYILAERVGGLFGDLDRNLADPGTDLARP